MIRTNLCEPPQLEFRAVHEELAQLMHLRTTQCWMSTTCSSGAYSALAFCVQVPNAEAAGETTVDKRCRHSGRRSRCCSAGGKSRVVTSSEGVPNSRLLYSRLRLRACGRSFCSSRRCNLLEISACYLGSGQAYQVCVSAEIEGVSFDSLTWPSEKSRMLHTQSFVGSHFKRESVGVLVTSCPGSEP